MKKLPTSCGWYALLYLVELQPMLQAKPPCSPQAMVCLAHCRMASTHLSQKP